VHVGCIVWARGPGHLAVLVRTGVNVYIRAGCLAMAVGVTGSHGAVPV